MSDNLNPQQFDPMRGLQYNSLTASGQAYYVDRRSEGDDHDRAFELARHSYGLRPQGMRETVKHPMEAKRKFLPYETVDRLLPTT